MIKDPFDMMKYHEVLLHEEFSTRIFRNFQRNYFSELLWTFSPVLIIIPETCSVQNSVKHLRYQTLSLLAVTYFQKMLHLRCVAWMQFL